MPIDISVVVPIFNEQEIIGLFYDELRAAMDGCGCTWELVYVDDGSRDDSLPRLLALQQRDPRITVLELSRNWGHQSALTAGLTVARGEAVVLMDGDLQDPPQVLPDLIASWRRGAQVVGDTSAGEWHITGTVTDYSSIVFGLTCCAGNDLAYTIASFNVFFAESLSPFAV